MGTDGIAVEKVMSTEAHDANLDVAAAEFTSLVRNAQRSGNDIGLGNVRELVVQLESAIIIMRLFTRDYFVVLALKPDGNYGRGRFESKSKLHLRGIAIRLKRLHTRLRQDSPHALSSGAFISEISWNILKKFKLLMISAAVARSLASIIYGWRTGNWRFQVEYLFGKWFPASHIKPVTQLAGRRTVWRH